ASEYISSCMCLLSAYRSFSASNVLFFFFFTAPAPTEIYTLSLHDALPIWREVSLPSEENGAGRWALDHLFLDSEGVPTLVEVKRSEEHTSELQSPCNLVCRLLLEKKKEAYKSTYARTDVSCLYLGTFISII